MFSLFRKFALGTAAGAGLMASHALATTPASQTADFTLEASCQQVFPLFTAAGERLWAGPDWDPKILSGSVERGSVFLTRAHRSETVWVVTEYNPDQGRVSYARIAQGSNMGLVDVRCKDLPNGTSRIIVTYTLTAVSPEGTSFVNHFLSAKHFKKYIAEWKKSIDVYLKSVAEDADRIED